MSAYDPVADGADACEDHGDEVALAAHRMDWNPTAREILASWLTNIFWLR